MPAKPLKYYLIISAGILMLLLIVFGYTRYNQKIKRLEDELAEATKIIDSQEEAIKSAETGAISLEAQSELEGIISKLQPKLDPKLGKQYAAAIVKSSRRWRFPPEFIACLVKRESEFNPVAESKAGAVGPLQIMAKLHQRKIEKRNLKPEGVCFIEPNIDIGCEILREYYDRSEENIRTALLRYVGSVNNNRDNYVNDILETFAEMMIGKINIRISKSSNQSKPMIENQQNSTQEERCKNGQDSL